MTKNEKLQEFFDFTNEDLEENRQGRVSEDQLALVKIKLQNEITAIVFVFVVLGFIALVISFGNSQNSAAFQKTLFTTLAVGVMAAIYILFRYAYKSDYSLSSIEGKANFVWVEERVKYNGTYRTTRRLKLHIKDISFDVKKDLLEIIDQGDHCRFYYTNGGDIVSVECLNNN
jgi:hypothetical protein